MKIIAKCASLIIFNEFPLFFAHFVLKINKMCARIRGGELITVTYKCH